MNLTLNVRPGQGQQGYRGMTAENGRNMNKSQNVWPPCNSPLKVTKVVRELEHVKKRPTKIKPRRNLVVAFPVESTKMGTDSSERCAVVEQGATGASCNPENCI